MSKAWSKDIVLDECTFGDSRACRVLAQMMNEGIISDYEKHKVLSFINSFILDFHNLRDIRSSSTRHRAILLIHQSYKDRIKQMPYPIKFRTFLQNVLSFYVKKVLEKK